MDRVEKLKFYQDSVINSYGQVFFSNSKTFSILLMIASFADPVVGICGLLSLIFTTLLAKGLGLSGFLINSGAYGYNSLMTGFVLGVYYQVNPALLVVLLFGSGLTLLLTVWLSSWLTSRKLPYLSIPFVLGVWIILLSSRSFESLQLSERGVFSTNELWSYGGQWAQSIKEIHMPLGLDLYLKSLGAIIFQYNLVSGILVAVGLLIYSRIAFSLSLIGFYSGYFFCYFVQGSLPELEYSYIGFNFILTAIALGGFFVIPSAKSYALALMAMPLVTLLMIALGRAVFGLSLPVYSLPFSILVILILIVLGQRVHVKQLLLTQFQEFSPERNFYAHHTRTKRFGKQTYFQIHLPFFGTWQVSQGHSGKITHREGWRHALDFVVTDEIGKTFKLPGKSLTDFYCYGLPVLSPASGYVVNLQDNVQDNTIGEVNLLENWGNSIVIKHGDYLFSKLSHIKPGSFKVKVGDYVNRGDVLALCGNSGRSPEPHLHFQLQSSPEIGANTLDYPISYFVSSQEGVTTFHSFENPTEGLNISRPELSTELKDAFRFDPGTRFKFKVNGSARKEEAVEWEVGVDAYNQSFIRCLNTGSYAWFINNETVHYFLNFKGNRNSLLYYFYLGMQKVPLVSYPGMMIQDVLPLDNFYNDFLRTVQDFAAPFYVYLKADFQMVYPVQDNRDSTTLELRSTAKVFRGRRELRKIDFELSVEKGLISKFKISEGAQWLTAESF